MEEGPDAENDHVLRRMIPVEKPLLLAHLGKAFAIKLLSPLCLKLLDQIIVRKSYFIGRDAAQATASKPVVVAAPQAF